MHYPTRAFPVPRTERQSSLAPLPRGFSRPRIVLAPAGRPKLGPWDLAERCLGHVIGGVRGVYDRHPYIEEMRHAFEALASRIERILILSVRRKTP